VKALLEQYAAYNIWANQRLLETILTLPESQLQQELSSSFASLYSTLMHLWDAESIWWQRIKMHDIVTAPSVHFKGSTRDVAAALLHQNNLWHSWIQTATPAALEHVFHYQNSKKEKFRQPTYEMLLHMFNHATYHRGQMVTMLRTLNVTTIPATDFIVYTRTNK
jgi:uncharacterized damage-inducible protein DinB